MKTNITTTTISAKASASILASLLDDVAEAVTKETRKAEGRLHSVSIPERISDETVKASIMEADATFEASFRLGEAMQARQNAAVIAWKKAGLTKSEASARCKALCIAMGKSAANARSIACRAMEAAEFDKDESKVKARKARKGKGKVHSPVARVLACAQHHAKGQAAVIKLLKAALAAAKAGE